MQSPDTAGDAEVLRLNPQRRDRILQATGWMNLFPGTLNLTVEKCFVHQILLCATAIRESGEDVKYPKNSRDIQMLRVGYLYFHGRISKDHMVEPVLIRRACNTQCLETTLEALSSLKLWDALKLSDEDQIVCEVDE